MHGLTRAFGDCHCFPVRLGSKSNPRNAIRAWASRTSKVWNSKATGRVEYPNPKRKRGTISQVPHLRIGL